MHPVNSKSTMCRVQFPGVPPRPRSELEELGRPISGTTRARLPPLRRLSSRDLVCMRAGRVRLLGPSRIRTVAERNRARFGSERPWVRSPPVRRHAGQSTWRWRLSYKEHAHGFNSLAQHDYPPVARRSCSRPISDRSGFDSLPVDSWCAEPAGRRRRDVTPVLAGSIPVAHPRISSEPRRYTTNERLEKHHQETPTRCLDQCQRSMSELRWQ